MCGRMSATFDAETVALLEKFMITKINQEFGPRYNVAPSQPVPVVVPGPPTLDMYKWGLIPHWAKDPKIGNKLINARAETLTEKPSFRKAFKQRRCLVLSSGFYEWDKEKQPHHIQIKDQAIFAFAGLWEEWTSPQGDVIKSCTVITCEPNSFMKKLHNRMPVILESEDYTAWLTSENDQVLRGMLKPIDSQTMTEYPVSREVNSPRNDSPEVLKPMGGKGADERKGASPKGVRRRLGPSC